MRLIRDIYREKAGSGRPVISFEFFPPKTEEGDRNLLEKTIPALLKLQPDFCSVTYGAGGSTRDKTLTIVDRIQKEHRLPAMSHLTCVNATAAELSDYLDQAKARGICNILALRGDPPGGTGEFKITRGGFAYSWQLVDLIRSKGGFSIGTAGFPEGHIACKEGKYVDWGYLKEKVDRGADFVITQLFFDNADFHEFRDHLAKLGVNVPIVPGILPILSAAQIKRFTALCGARLPEGLVHELDKFGEDEASATAYGIDFATRQCEELLRQGVPGLHLYTLNKVHSTSRIMENLGFSQPSQPR
jgi:methylenetetrahydrofolate reductase (NADPH)